VCVCVCVCMCVWVCVCVCVPPAAQTSGAAGPVSRIHIGVVQKTNRLQHVSNTLATP
jgi:hypothetical protein